VGNVGHPAEGFTEICSLEDTEVCKGRIVEIHPLPFDQTAVPVIVEALSVSYTV
jgi:hypothetical protein